MAFGRHSRVIIIVSAAKWLSETRMSAEPSKRPSGAQYPKREKVLRLPSTGVYVAVSVNRGPFLWASLF